MEEHRFVRQFGLAVLVDLWVAALAFVTFMVLVDGPPAYESFTIPSVWWAVYFGVTPPIVASYLCRNLQRHARPPIDHDGVVRVISLQVPLMLAAYVAGAAAVVTWDAGARGAVLSPGVLTIVTGAALTCIAYCGIPLFLHLQTVAGRYLGSNLPARVLVPAVSTVLVLAVGIAFVGSSSFLLYETVAKGVVDTNGVVLWIMLMAYAAILCALAYRHYTQSIAPIRDVMAHLASPTDIDTKPIVARSLDEIGAMTVQMKRLLMEQAAAQRARRDNQARLTMFAESAGDYFFELDADLRFTFLSDRFESFAGVPRSDVLGLTMAELSGLLGAEDPHEHQAALEKHLPYRNFRISALRPDGGVLHLQMNAIPNVGADGTFLGYLGSGTNVTDIVEAQQALRMREAELAQAQKMEAVGQLTGGIAHDFNNLLTAVLGNLELLDLASADRADLRPYVQSAMAAARRGGALTQRLLAFSRRQSLNPESIDVTQLFDDIADLLRRTLGEDVEVHVRAPSSLWPAYVDRNQLESAIVNLALNARDAMPRGGELRFEVDNQPSRDAGEPDRVRIRVTDNGSGIGPDVLPHVFEPFFTTKGPGEGSGLGLSMVQGFMKQSGGDVSIESVEGSGTTVTLELPRASMPPSAGKPPQDGPARPGDGHTVLVIEDDPGVGAVVTEALSGIGYNVVIAADSDEALERADALKRLDLLICDVVLPGARSGIEVATIIRRRRPDAKVMFMSGYAPDEIQRRSGLGLDVDILKKPFRLTELALYVTRALDGS